MAEIEFFHFRPGLDLTPFEEKSHVSVKNRSSSMNNAWAELLQFALHLKGPDVSEVGMTWLGSLAGMQVLHAFGARDLRLIQEGSHFVKFAWQNCQFEDSVMAVPWHADTRLFYYRRDIFEKLHIDESNAFATPEQIEETLLRLHAGGYTVPWLFNAKEYVIHFLAPWIWWYGGSFRSADGRTITLTEPEALKGLAAYLKLVRLLPSWATSETAYNPFPHFVAGESPIFYCGDWTYAHLIQSNPGWFESIGAAAAPGQPYVGAMYLVQWKHSLYEEQSLNLIRYLTSLETMRHLFEKHRLTPLHVELLNSPPFTTHPVYQAISYSLQHGRTFNNQYRWAGVESRLNSTFSQLIIDVINNPNLDIEKELMTRMQGVKTKLERTILA